MSIDWSGCRNVRDLGGLPTLDGQRIWAGALVRSDRHDHLTAGAIQAVRAGGIGCVLDLRWRRECETHPSPFVDDAFYRHVPMLNDVLDYVPPPDTYAPMLDHNRQRIGAAFRAVAEAPPGGVVVHCHAGRDRTGVLVALLLSVAGVGADTIAEDYARTEACSPQTMLDTLAHLDRHYGGAASYLTEAGVAAGALSAVRERLRGIHAPVEAAPSSS
ncbi:tyrosine protein phosphatase [Micromonospora globispora]|uniref:Tyrosine protein phosphatase n=1 Tax=Micromonospora globispora TaxID=1450148 RepID=A0A317JWI3_9ACTN|nr:tyrosine-protein phosphatase [Micromonospora globispora]PWU43862.1 tyrosine protein phosphatase [Micromonospora globispora]PWU55902.1 tyrosine protein phosphatase [Micromonospora globispora]RQW97545.1 tyrosine protein phosphatase [Micromonospora globispora]